MSSPQRWQAKDQPRIETKILILSDTHAALPEWLPPEGAEPWADVVVHCGDLTNTGKLEEHYRALSLLRRLPAPLKIVIPGNHDMTLDRAYCDNHTLLYGWSRPVIDEDIEYGHQAYTDQKAAEAGIVYMVEGTRTFTLSNGAKLTVYANAYTPEFCDWAFAYPRDVDRFNTSSPGGVPSYPESTASSSYDLPGKVDVIITHGPPRGILDKTTRGESVGCDHLLRAVARCKPLLHCFGHIHEGWGVTARSWSGDDKFFRRELEQLSKEEANPEHLFPYIPMGNVLHGQGTVFVNSSIMDVQYNPCQRARVAFVMLPAA